MCAAGLNVPESNGIITIFGSQVLTAWGEAEGADQIRMILEALSLTFNKILIAGSYAFLNVNLVEKLALNLATSLLCFSFS